MSDRYAEFYMVIPMHVYVCILPRVLSSSSPLLIFESAAWATTRGEQLSSPWNFVKECTKSVCVL